MLQYVTFWTVIELFMFFHITIDNLLLGGLEMKKCSHCNSYVTEFDQYVFDRVFPNSAGNCDVCFKCCFDRNGHFERKRERDKNVALGVRLIMAPFVFFGILLLFCAIFYLFIRDPEIYTVFSLIIGFPLFISLVLYCLNFGLELIDRTTASSEETYHEAKTWYELKTDYKGDVYAEKHYQAGHYSSGDNSTVSFFLLLTLPIWVIPYTIILASIKKFLLHRNVPKQILDAYYEAKRCVPEYRIFKSKENRSLYLHHFYNIKTFYKKAAGIEKKYSALGENIVWNEIRKLYFPVWKLKLDGIIYVVVDYRMDKKKKVRLDCPIYIIGKNNHNEYIGGAIVNGYLTSMDVISDLNEWVKKNYFSDNTQKYLRLYQNCL